MNHQKTPDLHKRHWLRAAGGTLAALVLAALLAYLCGGFV